MREALEKNGGGYQWYKARRSEYDTKEKIPFLVSPEPLFLSQEEGEEILKIGQNVVRFMGAVDTLYRKEKVVKDLLDRGKPKAFQGRESRYLFVRPDLLITDKGFSICEIETSPFGLALAELLNKSYSANGFTTMVDDGILETFINKNTPATGTIIYNGHTSSYAGQLEFLAEKVFSTNGRKWNAQNLDFVSDTEDNMYRAFYQHEYADDLFANNLICHYLENKHTKALPSSTPHMEEKALLALIWDKRWKEFFVEHLGKEVFQHLRIVIPPTWILGQEEFFAPGLPHGIASTAGLADLGRSKRNFVLKKSGFGKGSSWAEGVSFLQEKSSEKTRSLLGQALADADSLYIIQEFTPSKERQLFYESGRDLQEMKARIRVTPYFSMSGDDPGALIAIKATGCEKTNYIHASSGSINTAVGIK